MIYRAVYVIDLQIMYLRKNNPFTTDILPLRGIISGIYTENFTLIIKASIPFKAKSTPEDINHL